TPWRPTTVPDPSARPKTAPIGSAVDGMYDDAFVARVFAFDEPRRPAAREPRCPAGRGAEPVTDGREARLDLEGGGLEVVSARARVRPTQRVPPPVHLGGRAPERRDHQRVRGWLERQRFDHLTDAPDPGAPADQAERHVGAEGGGSGGVGDARPAQHGRGVGGSAAEAGTGRDALVDLDVGAPLCQRERAAYEVRVVDRQAGAGAGDLEPIAVAERQRVEQVDGDHLGVEQVVAVVAHAGDPQRQRQLRGCAHDRDRADLGAGGGRRHARASLPHSITDSSSARASGRTPESSNAAGSTSPASARRSILRRWPNPARTSAKSRTGSASVAGFGRRTIRTRTDSTFGGGRNTFGPTRATTSASAQYATLTEGMPYAALAGRAASRSPASRCTITKSRSI